MMPVQVRAAFELEWTLTTLERTDIRMGSSVEVKIPFHSELLRTEAACERALPRVGAKVND